MCLYSSPGPSIHFLGETSPESLGVRSHIQLKWTTNNVLGMCPVLSCSKETYRVCMRGGRVFGQQQESCLCTVDISEFLQEMAIIYRSNLSKTKGVLISRPLFPLSWAGVK